MASRVSLVRLNGSFHLVCCATTQQPCVEFGPLAIPTIFKSFPNAHSRPAVKVSPVVVGPATIHF